VEEPGALPKGEDRRGEIGRPRREVLDGVVMRDLHSPPGGGVKGRAAERSCARRRRGSGRGGVRTRDPAVGGVLAVGHGADPAGVGLHSGVLTLGNLRAQLPRLTAWAHSVCALAEGGAGSARDVGEGEALRLPKVGREGGVARGRGRAGRHLHGRSASPRQRTGLAAPSTAPPCERGGGTRWGGEAKRGGVARAVAAQLCGVGDVLLDRTKDNG
jgi:hypothetical protein